MSVSHNFAGILPNQFPRICTHAGTSMLRHVLLRRGFKKGHVKKRRYVEKKKKMLAKRGMLQLSSSGLILFSVVMVQEYEGQGAQLKHEAAVVQFDEMELEGYGPFR